MTNKLFNNDEVNYILRYYLPEWNVDERLGEIIDFCQRTKTRHVMFLCNCQHMAWNIIPLEIAKSETETFKKVKKQFDKHDIKFGLNMGNTFGHGQNRWDHRDKFPHINFWRTDMTGRSSHCTPCPEDPALKDHVRRLYKIYAQCEPQYIYIDDDMRFEVSDSEWGCFCQKHLDKFADITNCKWHPGQLKQALYEDPKVRKAWIELLGQCVIDWAKDLTVAVHDVNPSIRMGLMVPCLHLTPVFGYNLKEVVNQLDHIVKPVVRPCIGGYFDWNRRDLVGGLIYMEQVSHLLKGLGIEFTPELETTPFTRFSKSMKVVRFHITHGILNGGQNPAITAAGYVGDSIKIEPEYFKLLPESKGYFDALCKIRPDKAPRRGIQLIYDFDSAKKSAAKINSPTDLIWSSFELAKNLGSLGLSYTFDDSSVKMITGETFMAMNNKEIETLLSGNLILDAPAAETLADFNYSNKIGLNIGKKPLGWIGEHCTDKDFFGPYVNSYIPLKNADQVYHLLPSHKAKVISTLVDADRQEVCSGVVLYENKSGGKIAVLPYPIKAISIDTRHLLCYHRRYMLKKVIEWMDPYALPVFVNEPTDFLVQAWEDEKYLSCCITNLSYDCFNEVQVEFSHKSRLDPGKAEFLDVDGTVKPLAAEQIENKQGSIQKWLIKDEFTAFKSVYMRIKL